MKFILSEIQILNLLECLRVTSGQKLFESISSENPFTVIAEKLLDKIGLTTEKTTDKTEALMAFEKACDATPQNIRKLPMMSDFEEEIGMVGVKSEKEIESAISKITQKPENLLKFFELLAKVSPKEVSNLVEKALEKSLDKKVFDALKEIVANPSPTQSLEKILEDSGITDERIKKLITQYWKPKVEIGTNLKLGEPNIMDEPIPQAPKIEIPTTPRKKFSPEFKLELKTNKDLYKKKYGEDAYLNLRQDFMSGSISSEEFLERLKPKTLQLAKANFDIKFGINFSKKEVKNIENMISNFKKGEFSESWVVLEKFNKEHKVPIYFYDRNWVERHFSPKEAENWMKCDGMAFAEPKQIWINEERYQYFSEDYFRNLVYHESAHIKDPSITNEKLELRYDISEYYTDKYFFHQWEKVANRSGASGYLTGGVRSLIKNNFSKEYILNLLSNMKNIIKSSSSTVDLDALLQVGFGDMISSNIKTFREWSEKFPQDYKKFMINLYKNIDSLEEMVNRIM